MLEFAELLYWSLSEAHICQYLSMKKTEVAQALGNCLLFHLVALISHGFVQTSVRETQTDTHDPNATVR